MNGYLEEEERRPLLVQPNPKWRREQRRTPEKGGGGPSTNGGTRLPLPHITSTTSNGSDEPDHTATGSSTGSTSSFPPGHQAEAGGVIYPTAPPDDAHENSSDTGSSGYSSIQQSRPRESLRIPPPRAGSSPVRRHLPVHRSAPSQNGALQPPFASPARGTGPTPRIKDQQTNWQTRGALIAILLAVVLERICFYALTGNLVLFLNKNPFHWESYHAMNALFLFFGVTYVMSLLGGWLADAYLGRFRTMLLAYLVYVCGYALMPLFAEDSHFPWNPTPLVPANDTRASLPLICGGGRTNDGGHPQDKPNPFRETCAWQIYLALVVIGMGSGSLKANLCPFGSDQLPRASQSTQLSFFNWYYWCINFGSFVGLGILCFVEQQYSFLLAFLICSGMLLGSALVFAIGRVFYTCRAPDGSVLTNVFRVLMEAFRRWRLRRQTRKQQERLRQAVFTSQLSREDAPNSSSVGTEDLRDMRNIKFLDYAKHQHGGVFHASLVDDVKKLGMITIVFAVLVPYWIVYFQMQTTFLFQALHMRLDIHHEVPLIPITSSSPPLSQLTSNTPATYAPAINGTTMGTKPQIVAAWFSLFDAIFVIILLPLFDRVIYPRMTRAGHPFTFTSRILMGMVFAMAAMVVAGIVEYYRLEAFWPYDDTPCVNASIPQYIAGTMYEAANMSVFWQIPQYALIGMSEVFTSVACLQFAVSVSPKSMKALITGMFYCFCGLGSFMGTGILSALANSDTWIYSHDYGNINCRLPCDMESPPVWDTSCHLDYYFFSLAGLAFIAIILFLIVSRVYGLGSNRLSMNQAQLSPAEEERRRRQRHLQTVQSGQIGSTSEQFSS